MPYPSEWAQSILHSSAKTTGKFQTQTNTTIHQPWTHLRHAHGKGQTHFKQLNIRSSSSRFTKAAGRAERDEKVTCTEKESTHRNCHRQQTQQCGCLRCWMSCSHVLPSPHLPAPCAQKQLHTFSFPPSLSFPVNSLPHQQFKAYKLLITVRFNLMCTC